MLCNVYALFVHVNFNLHQLELKHLVSNVNIFKFFVVWGIKLNILQLLDKSICHVGHWELVMATITILRHYTIK